MLRLRLLLSLMGMVVRIIMRMMTMTMAMTTMAILTMIVRMMVMWGCHWFQTLSSVIAIVVTNGVVFKSYGRK